jgi:non-ribosomal peptide synthetase component F
VSFWLSEELSRELKELSQREGVTLFMMLLAAFKVLLNRYTDEEDVVVGTIVSTRTHADLEKLIGVFINQLIIRTNVSADLKFTNLLQSVKQVCLDGYAHQDVPFEKIIEELRPERSLGSAPICRITFGVQNPADNVLTLPELLVSPMGVANNATRYDLTLWILNGPTRLSAQWTYNGDLFERERIVRMHRHFESLLRSIVKAPDAHLDVLELLTQEEMEEQTQKNQVVEDADYNKFVNVKPKPLKVSRVVGSD